MQNFCTNCGTKISGTPKFCPECGAKLQSITEVSKEEAGREPQVENTPSEDQRMDPKIKGIALIIVGLFISLIITELIFNFPIKSSLNFSDDEGNQLVEMINKAQALAKDEGNLRTITDYTGYSPSAVKLASIMLDLRKIPLIPKSGDYLKVTLLVFFMIIVTFALTELIKEPARLKWLIILANLMVGLIFSYIVSNWGYSIFAGLIFFNLIAFYNSNKIKYWIIIPAVLAFLFNPAIQLSTTVNGYFARAQLSSFVYSLLNFLQTAALFILPCLAFYLFLKEYVHGSRLKVPLQVSSKEQYEQFKSKIFHS